MFFLYTPSYPSGWDASHPARVMTVDNGVVTTDKSMPFYLDVHGQSLDALSGNSAARPSSLVAFGAATLPVASGRAGCW